MLEDAGQAELVDRGDPGRDDAHDEADRAALLKRVAAEASEALDAVGQVHFLRRLELLRQVRREQRLRESLGVGPLEPLLFAGDHERSVHAHHRVAADLEVQVGRAGGHGDLKKLVDMHAVRGSFQAASFQLPAFSSELRAG